MEKEIKKCFVITPIGPESSEIRRAAEGVIDSSIVPILENEGYEVSVAHRMYDAGSINKQIISRILTDDLVIANLTGLNPNVMYEVAVRHAVRKPIVIICEKGTKLPFDITEERTLFFTNDMAGVVEIKENLKNMINESIRDQNPDNPIYRASEEINILRNVKDADPEKYDILLRMDDLESKIISLIKRPDIYNPRLVNHSKVNRYYLVGLTFLETDIDIENIVSDLSNLFDIQVKLLRTKEFDALFKILIPSTQSVKELINYLEELGKNKWIVTSGVKFNDRQMAE